jgi:hypothetical protein
MDHETEVKSRSDVRSDESYGQVCYRGRNLEIVGLHRSKIICFVDRYEESLSGCVCNAESLAIREGFVDKAAGIP